MAINENQTILLNTGQHMPIIGLGTWQGKAEETELAIEAALNAGYRHFDTAFNYHNEEAIGNALEKWIKSGLGKREDIFIVTKLPHIGMRASDVPRYLEKSLHRLKLEYVDLYLVHLPFGFTPDPSGETASLTEQGGPVIDMSTDHVAIWKAMETEFDTGRVRSIGLSNFNPSQINRVLENARIKPAILQVEIHALHQQKPLRAFCSQVNLPVVAFSPLASPAALPHFKDKYGHLSSQVLSVLEQPVVKKIAAAHNKSPAQVLLRHLVQQGIGVIPKSSNPERLRENYQIFDFLLTQEEMQELDKLDLDGKGRIFDFLFFKGVETHPEYPFPEVIKA